MQIQTVVTAFMVMPVPSINPLVPDPAHFLQTLWFLPVQFLQKVLFHLLAVAVLPLYIYLKCLIDQIFLAVHDVGDVPQCPCIMGCRIDMHMDACILSCHCTCMPELPDEFLYDRDIRVFTDRGNKFYLVLTPRITAAFFLRLNAGVIHDFPSAACRIPDTVLFIASAVIAERRGKIGCHDLRSTLSGNACHLDLNAEFLLPHVHSLASLLPFSLLYRPPALPNSFSLYSGACTMRL